MEHINSQTLTKRLTLSVVAACLISFCGFRACVHSKKVI